MLQLGSAQVTRKDEEASASATQPRKQRKQRTKKETKASAVRAAAAERAQKQEAKGANQEGACGERSNTTADCDASHTTAVCWLHAVPRIDLDEMRDAFEMGDAAVVVKVNACKSNSMDDVTRLVQAQAKKCLKATGQKRDDAAFTPGTGAPHATAVIHFLIGIGGLIVGFKKGMKQKSIDAVVQFLQCFDQVACSFREHSSDSFGIAILEGWLGPTIRGPQNIDSTQNLELVVTHLEEQEDDSIEDESADLNQLMSLMEASGWSEDQMVGVVGQIQAAK